MHCMLTNHFCPLSKPVKPILNMKFDTKLMIWFNKSKFFCHSHRLATIMLDCIGLNDF